MLLCIDIGNSSISLGIFDTTAKADRPEPRLTAKLSADVGRTADEYAIMLRGICGGHLANVDEAVMGSVVPRLTHTLEQAVRQLCGGEAFPILHIGGGVRSGISLRVDDPTGLGADIVTNAAAAVRLYGAPVVFFDYGTATVCGAINAARELVGVSIAPGVQTSLEGLRAAAAQIPYSELKPPEGLLGRNTPASIRAGVITGTACMTDGMIDRLRDEWHLPTDAPLTVVATGGLASLVLPACRREIRHEPMLTLLGLYYIRQATREREQRLRQKHRESDS